MAPRVAELACETAVACGPPDAAAEANHRIANNLTIVAEYVRCELLSLSQDNIPDLSSIRRSLQQLSLRIDAIGRLHRLLTSSSPATSVEICAYLAEIADAVRCSLAQVERMNILCSFDTEALVTAKQATAIGAIVSEALANSIKHSHPFDAPGIIKIACRRSHYGLIVEVKDDGVGRAREFPGKESSRGGAGTDLMRTFARSLNAKLEMIDGHDGHTVRFELPLFAGRPDERPQGGTAADETGTRL